MEEAPAFWDLTWDRLLAREQMAPDMPEWRDEWAPDRRYLVFLVEVGEVPEVVETARRICQTLEGLGIRTVPTSALHLTICEVGFVDELADDPLTIAAQSAEALRGRRATTVGIVGAGSFDAAAVLQIAPFEALRDIEARLLSSLGVLATRRSVAGRPATEGGFAPHISLAYYEDPVPARAVAGALKPFRRMHGPRFVVDTVSLASVPPPVEHFTWDVVARFPLLSG